MFAFIAFNNAFNNGIDNLTLLHVGGIFISYFTGIKSGWLALHVCEGFCNSTVLGCPSAFRAKSIYHVCIEMRQSFV